MYTLVELGDNFSILLDLSHQEGLKPLDQESSAEALGLCTSMICPPLQPLSLNSLSNTLVYYKRYLVIGLDVTDPRCLHLNGGAEG